MPEQVRVGVIGTGGFADFFHLPNLKSHPKAEVVAICGRNHARAAEMARKYDIPQVFTDHTDLIAHGRLDAVVVVTPDDQHYPMTMCALEAGLHVLCEKSLALNATQARAMYEKAEAMHVKHMTFFTGRWVPYAQYMHTLVEQGYLGRCYHCNMRYVAGYGRDGQYAWRFDRQRGNGILGDFGSHMIDLARWYVGDIAKVSAHLATFVERPGANGQPLDPANDSALLLLEFTNGAHGVIQVSAVAHTAERGSDGHMTLHGEQGTLEADLSFAIESPVRGARSAEGQFHDLPTPRELWGEVDRNSSAFNKFVELFRKQSVGDRLFIDAIVEDRPVSPSFYEGLKVQEVIDAAIKSHEDGCWVAVR